MQESPTTIRDENPPSMAVADRALVDSILQRDRKATAEFVALYADDVYGYVRARLAPHYDLVEDLVQEIFLAAWQSLANFQASGPLKAWVIGIARHKLEDHYRQRLRAPQSLEETEEEPVAASSADDFHSLLEQEQLRNNTRRVLRSLPETYRLALIWRYWEKASTREIAAKTGRTEKGVERLLARARAEFRERWKYAESA